ncbi:glycoside hydrolase family 19 chitinase protein [Rhizobium phage RHph_N28_2]|nr:glycoside hydrolase family 19 chitinase protein [Rhizobium phage RHph_N28_2]
MDRSQFFAAVRTSVFGGSLAQSQVDGIEAILDGCAAEQVADQRHVAYILATPMIETGGTYRPIVENLNYSAQGLRRTFPRYFSDAESIACAKQPQRIANRAYANRMGNGDEGSGDGWRYRGRGYCQITGLDNYAKFGRLLGADLVANPDLALQNDIAGKIIVVGMRDGLFTGKALRDYFTSGFSDWVNARRIINGLDRAGDIARYAKLFNAALQDAS